MTDNTTVIYLATLQFHWGGLFDTNPHDDLVHLVRGTQSGTPGPTLCGIDRLAKGGPGWSVGGGVTGPHIRHDPCPSCVTTAEREFPGLPVAGMREMSGRIATEIGVPHYGHSVEAIRASERTPQ
jgi:hypothetical protein